MKPAEKTTSGGRWRWLPALLIGLALTALWPLSRRLLGPVRTAGEGPAETAVWPWPEATHDRPGPGLERWRDNAALDGSQLELLAVDLRPASGLRLGLYDQDEDDATPDDTRADYWSRGVGPVVAHLEALGRGPVVAAWNGPFFVTDVPGQPRRTGTHLAPVVRGGRVLYDSGSVRWTFGWQVRAGATRLKMALNPSREALLAEFDVACGGAQYLVRDGQPLVIRPPRRPSDPPLPRPVPTMPDEAGCLPLADHAPICRTALGWAADSSRLWVLLVRQGADGRGGWTLPELQRFWLALGAAHAVNLDGGLSTQAIVRRADGLWDLIPPWPTPRRTLADPATGPAGGTLLTYYVTRAPAGSAGEAAK